jgi:hypothetical protein
LLAACAAETSRLRQRCELACLDELVKLPPGVASRRCPPKETPAERAPASAYSPFTQKQPGIPGCLHSLSVYRFHPMRLCRPSPVAPIVLSFCL